MAEEQDKMAPEEVDIKTDKYFYRGQVKKDSKGKQVFHGMGALFDEATRTKYMGEFKDGLKSGSGTLEYLSDDKKGQEFCGEWLDDHMHGKGIMRYADGGEYHGDFEKGERTSGVWKMANGDEYAGNFKDDLFDGYSLLKYSNGDQFCGDFIKGKRDGQGILKVLVKKACAETGQEEEYLSYIGEFEDDQLYTGQLKTSYGSYLGQFKYNEEKQELQYHGKGIMQFSMGDVYEGKWSEGQIDGYGLYLYAKDNENDISVTEATQERRAQYQGIYQNGKRVEGTMTYENGDVYYGTYNLEDGTKECGVQKYANGDEYSGDFKAGAKHNGVMKYKSGDIYSGEWKEGLFHGSGKIIFESGLKYQGLFENGNKHGQGILTLPATKEDAEAQSKAESKVPAGVNGGQYTGDFVDDQMEGNGQFLFPDGSEYVGEFKAGIQQGYGLLTLADGTEMCGKWNNGEYTDIEYNIKLTDKDDDEEGEQQTEQDAKPADAGQEDGDKPAEEASNI